MRYDIASVSESAGDIVDNDNNDVALNVYTRPARAHHLLFQKQMLDINITVNLVQSERRISG